MRPMTRRERVAARKAWDAFQPNKQYGNYVVCMFVEENQAWEALKEQVREFVPERFWHKIEWLRKLIDPRTLWEEDKYGCKITPRDLSNIRDLSIGWSYSP